MIPNHPCPELPRGLVERVFERRGRLHAYERLDPSRAALVVVDMDAGSCAREPDTSSRAIDRINAVSRSLRTGGGTVAFVTSAVRPSLDLERRLGTTIAARYVEETKSGGAGTILAADLVVDESDLRAVKLGASAFFPGHCDIHDRLEAQGGHLVARLGTGHEHLLRVVRSRTRWSWATRSR